MLAPLKITSLKLKNGFILLSQMITINKIKPSLYWWISYLLALANLLIFISRHAVDFLMLDRLATWRLVLLQDNWWVGFSEQMGTHRHGLMYVFSRLANAIQPENTTFDFYLHALVFASIPPILFFVRRKYFSGVDLLDLILPWVILSTRQWESLIVNPYTHTMLPIFIVWSIGILHVKSKKLILGLGGIWIFLSIFSTFAFFTTPIFVGILICRFVKDKRVLVFLSVATLLTLGLFFWGYDWNKGATGVDSNLVVAFKYALYWVSFFFDLGYVSYGHYAAAFLLLAFVWFFVRKWTSFTKQRREVFLLTFVPFILFFFAIGRGRNAVSPEVMTASRYFSAALPLFFSMYVSTDSFRLNKSFFTIVSLVSIFIAFGPFQRLFSPDPHQHQTYMSKVQEAADCVEHSLDWRTCQDDFQFVFDKHSEYATRLYLKGRE